MKLLTIAIPCYNSEPYMEKCIRSLLPGGSRVEIIIVDDGSQKDRTAEIADAYAKRYPDQVRAIHQENGGHGQAVMTGLKHATGLFFKVVDSDDWVNQAAYKKILDTLEDLIARGENIDMMVSNFVYEKEGAKHKKVMRYANAFPEGHVFTWSEMGNLHLGQYILMHSVIYRTRMLRECGLELPAHTFYVDNIFVYHPLPHVKKLYYLDVNFYRYYIGREDQSVNEKVMISRVDQQLRVNRLMIDDYDLKDIRDKRLRKYMMSYLEIMMTVSSIMLIRSHTKENLQKKDELWAYLKKTRPAIYRKLRHRLMGQTMNLPGRGGRKISEIAYMISQRLYGFN
ncbi:MAG: glycosyltransferase family 2 protein [Lachnospiraceae bacterium]|nr:glycosyltransferase family 2 protein [Lachnospiraceae bacterium]